MSTIQFQPEFRPALPCVFGSKDYREFRAVLIEMDRILMLSGVEMRLIRERIASYEEPLNAKHIKRHIKTLHMAIRYSILLAITGLSYRDLACRVADSHLFQWFTFTSFMDAIRPVSKSSIERFEKLIQTDELERLIHDLNRAAADAAGAERLLYRETELKFDQIFADTTCVKANIHFPVDWVLLRDAARTLIKAIELIREKGLKHRISTPQHFLTKMNKLCIEMTHTRKKRDGKKARKLILRQMKTLLNTIKRHAENYKNLLENHWEQTDWSEKEAQVVLDRINNILSQLPDAIHQAHERIIGERRVSNADKILSLYDPDIHVLIRGKTDAEVEFGNGLYLAEQADGLIADWEFMKDQPCADSKLVKPSLTRLKDNYAAIRSYTADRGFDTKANTLELEKLAIFNGICPRSVPSLQEKLEDEVFCLLQKRRGSTEARIGLFKNAFLGAPLRNKGFEHRKQRIIWCILGHNLWKLATMAAQKRAQLEESDEQKQLTGS